MSEENIDNRQRPHIRDLFQDFEADPPPQSWDLIRKRMEGSTWGSRETRSLTDLLAWFGPMNRLYPTLAVAGLALIALVVWVGVTPSHHIRGQAVDGQENLVRGTAYLFRVHDLHRPLDSVSLYQQQELDSAGRFNFKTSKNGAYLLRIHLRPDSGKVGQIYHGYYDKQLHWNNATLIHTDSLKESYIVKMPGAFPR